MVTFSKRTKRLNALLLIAIFFIALFGTFSLLIPSGVRAASTFTPAGGSGTSTNPYLISNNTQLKSLADYTNSGGTTSGKYYKLTADITLSSTYTPIGNASNKFKGNFDGGGHNIYSLNLSGTSGTTLGFFGYIDGATIKNIYLRSGSITNTYDTGALIGSASGSITIENCRNYGVSVTYPSSGTSAGQMGIGGLIGWAHWASGNISSCCNYATVCGYAINPYVGGIVGKFTGSISKCCNNGYIYAGTSKASETTHAGGICGYTSGSIEDCYNMVSVNAYAKATDSTGSSGTNYTLKLTTEPAYSGGICGGGASSISRCYNTGSIRGGLIKNVYTIECEVASAEHKESWSAHGYSGANYYAWTEILSGTITVYSKLNYNEIQPGLTSSSCYSADKISLLRRNLSFSLSSKMKYKWSISGGVYNPADTSTIDTGFSNAQTKDIYLSNFQISGSSTKGITSQVVSDLSGTTRSKEYNVVSNLNYTFNHSKTALSLSASYTLKTSYSSSTSKSVNIFSVTLDKSLGFTEVSSDADIKSKSMGTNWTKSSKINNGYPHLKSMYWEDNTSTPTQS